MVFFTNKDLVDVNHGYKYLFTTIDVFSKMAWVYPLKENKCVRVMECFQDILRKCGQKPERLNSDRGSKENTIFLDKIVFFCQKRKKDLSVS